MIYNTALAHATRPQPGRVMEPVRPDAKILDLSLSILQTNVDRWLSQKRGDTFVHRAADTFIFREIFDGLVKLSKDGATMLNNAFNIMGYIDRNRLNGENLERALTAAMIAVRFNSQPEPPIPRLIIDCLKEARGI